jgi:hypothetical protein
MDGLTLPGKLLRPCVTCRIIYRYPLAAFSGQKQAIGGAMLYDLSKKL